ncbi:MAG: hypothetical protein ACJ73S_22280 [Mycobacteriales bacterium]|jgi:ABC-type Na+ transport system ATPase subunit NatA
MTTAERDAHRMVPPDTLEGVREDIARTRGDLAATLTSLRQQFALRQRMKRRAADTWNGMRRRIRHPRGGA